jgi:excisionase family DNA binding protein
MKKLLLEGVSVVDFLDELKCIIKKEIQLELQNKNENDYLSRDEALDFLCCSSPTLIKYQKKGLPYYKIGRKIKFNKSEILDFLKQNTNKLKL